MDVGDHRERRLDNEPLERPDVVVARDGAADQVTPGVGDRLDLTH